MFLSEIEKYIFSSNKHLSTSEVINEYIDQLDIEDNQNKLYALKHLTNLFKGTCNAKKWRKFLHSMINSDQPLKILKILFIGATMKKEKLTARKADINKLYEESVQCPEFEVNFIKKLFKRYYNKNAEASREDFCASALISAEWVKDNINNTSLSIDLDKRMIMLQKKPLQHTE